MSYERFLIESRQRCDGFVAAVRSVERKRGEPADQRQQYDSIERLTLRYRELLNDLSLARERYPDSEIVDRLERLVLEGTLVLRENPDSRGPSIGRFFRDQFPSSMRAAFPSIGVMIGIFALAVIFGLGATAVRPELGWIFVGTEMRASLESGKLWTESIFSVAPGAVVASGIATNNMAVALTGWAGGALAGIGGFIVVILNGLMLGSVIAVTSRYSLADRLFEFIAAHGPLELTLILVSAGAGLHIGRALIVAGEESRGRALRRAGREAAIVLLGCLPWILLLGLVEGFISPAQLGLFTKVATGLGLESLFVLTAWRPTKGE